MSPIRIDDTFPPIAPFWLCCEDEGAPPEIIGEGCHLPNGDVAFCPVDHPDGVDHQPGTMIYHSPESLLTAYAMMKPFIKWLIVDPRGGGIERPTKEDDGL